MPRIIGYIKDNLSFNIEEMANSLLLTDKLKSGDKYEDNYVVISEVKLKSSRKQKMEEILKQPNEFTIRQNCDFISDYKNMHWENIKYNADLALKLVTLKINFDKILEISK